MTNIANAKPTHLADAQKLQSDGMVELWEINLIDGSVIRLKNNNTVIWRSNEYEAFSLQLDGEAQSNDGSVARPQLTIANPEGAFSPAIGRGELERAMVVRKRILKADLDANVNVSQDNSWTIARTVSLNKTMAVFELRGVGDMAFFVIPPRQFTPPEFSQVSLT